MEAREWKLVYLEVPDRDPIYVKACIKDCLSRGESPYYGEYLRGCDTIDAIANATAAWRPVSKKTVVYTDLGMNREMELGIIEAARRHNKVEFRTVVGWKEQT